MLTMIFGLLLILFPTIGCRSLLPLITTTLGKSWTRWVLFLLGTLDAGSQFWLFMWAPLNGEGINIAMGYFLFPLIMVVLGWAWLKERLSFIQKIALYWLPAVLHMNYGTLKVFHGQACGFVRFIHFII